MNPAVGPYAIAAALLLLGGARKVLRPGDTARALRLSGLPAGSGLVRVGGAAEVAIGATALSTASVVAASVVAASYAAFFVFIVNALARHLPIATCGCFGKADTPPSHVHLGVNLGACAAAVIVATDPGLAPVDVVTGEVPGGIAFAMLVVIGVGAAMAALVLLPRGLAQAREHGAS